MTDTPDLRRQQRCRKCGFKEADLIHNPEVQGPEPWHKFEPERRAQPEPGPLVRAAQKVIDELDNGYPGHDQYSCDVQYGTLEELRTALRARAGSSPMPSPATVVELRHTLVECCEAVIRKLSEPV